MPLQLPKREKNPRKSIRLTGSETSHAVTPASTVSSVIKSAPGPLPVVYHAWSAWFDDDTDKVTET